MSQAFADVELLGDWAEADALLSELANRALIDKALDEVAEAEAKFAAKELRGGIRTQSPGGKPLAPLKSTALMSRRVMGISSTQSLIASGTMMRSIKPQRVSRTEHWAGVPNKVVEGRNLAMIARMNEHGAVTTRRVTPAMHEFLGRLLGKAPAVGSQITARIQPRPFVEPVFNKFFTGKRAEKRIKTRMTIKVKALRQT